MSVIDKIPSSTSPLSDKQLFTNAIVDICKELDDGSDAARISELVNRAFFLGKSLNKLFIVDFFQKREFCQVPGLRRLRDALIYESSSTVEKFTLNVGQQLDMKKMTLSGMLIISGIASFLFAATVDEAKSINIGGFHMKTLALAASAGQILAPFAIAAVVVHRGVEHELL